MTNFAHLHVHSQFSLLDGQASVEGLVDKAVACGMPGIALTDHGVMFGIKKFTDYVAKINKGRETPFVPIIGCEMYVARRSQTVKSEVQDRSGWHLVVLAKNKTGYQNLIKLVSNAYSDGFYFKPRTDKAQLEKYKEGLIICSACLAGEVPKKINSGDIEGAEEAALWFKERWGEDYYLEIQRHKTNDPNSNMEAYPLEQVANKEILRIAEKHDIKVVCTNDVHFVNQEDAEAHERLICLSTGKKMSDTNRMLYTKQEWLKSQEEMAQVFSDVPETLENTLEIVNKVETYSIEHGPIMPTFEIPEDFGTEDGYREKYTPEDLIKEFTSDEHGENQLEPKAAMAKVNAIGGVDKLYRLKLEADYLAKLAFIGAEKYYPDMDDETKERLVFELHIMKTMGFPGYFLIVQDFIAAGRQMGVSVGPGRGSAAGSAVAYCLEITKIDPIKYDLLFERFLNPDRISLPDIDIDFDDDGRGKVLKWVTEKYGAEKVAHIITYGTMATKSALKDVARVEDVPLPVTNGLVKMIPDSIPDVKKVSISKAIDYVPELRQAAESNDLKLRHTMKFAAQLEGTVRNTGVHACGVIICRDPITDWVPVSVTYDKKTEETITVTQYEGKVIEDTGLIKMDFLGLKTLSIIMETQRNIKRSHGIDIDMDTIPIDDELTYQLFSEGRTVGVFQFESGGMQNYLSQLKPSQFEDLIAMNALYRPGPMENIPSFIRRKHGTEPVEYDLPIMERYLKDTYGITVYQEQVMLLARLLANFTRGESDGLRKAMGKKLRDKLDQMKPKFIEGGAKNGHPKDKLEKIWTDWEAFASYAFNKSHSTCYSWVAYQTAYLKAHYPAEFMAGNMSRSVDNITEITKLMTECQNMGINLLSPDVNESEALFAVNKDGHIRFGMSAVKNVGSSAVTNIIEEREKNGPYKDFNDFIERIDMRACNTRSIEHLVMAGAFDSFGLEREQLLFDDPETNENYVKTMMKFGKRLQSQKAEATMSLFGEDMVQVSFPKLPVEYPKWSDIERLSKERDLVGVYLSSHPLDRYRITLDYVCNTKVAELRDPEALRGRSSIMLGCIVSDVVEAYTKNNQPYGRITLEDFSGSHQIAIFGDLWANNKGHLDKPGNMVILHGEMRGRYRWSEEKEFFVNRAEFMTDNMQKSIDKLVLTIALPRLTDDDVDRFHKICTKSPGTTKISFHLVELREGYQPRILKLHAQGVQCALNNEIMDFIKEVGWNYQINL